MDSNNFLSRAEIDLILATITTKDLFAALPSGQTEINGGQMAGSVFEYAAERQGYGKEILDRISLPDGLYLASALGELFSDGPKDSVIGVSQVSVVTGDSDPS